jgi:hypothetical protein
MVNAELSNSLDLRWSASAPLHSTPIKTIVDLNSSKAQEKANQFRPVQITDRHFLWIYTLRNAPSLPADVLYFKISSLLSQTKLKVTSSSSLRSA